MLHCRNCMRIPSKAAVNRFKTKRFPQSIWEKYIAWIISTN